MKQQIIHNRARLAHRKAVFREEVPLEVLTGEYHRHRNRLLDQVQKEAYHMAQVQEVSSLPAAAKNPSDLEYLRFLLKDNPFFVRGHPEQFRQLKYVVHRRQKVIVRKGAVLNRFYVVLKGKVEAREPLDLAPDQKQVQYRPVKQLLPGDSFGQFSCYFHIGEKYQLFSGEQEVHLASFQKINNQLPQISQFLRESQVLHDSFTKCALLQSYNKTVVLDLINQMEKTTPRLGELIQKEGAPALRLHFILKGSFKLFKKRAVDRKSDFALKNHNESPIRNLGNRRLSTNNELSILSQYESFGEEIFLSIPHRYTVKCNQNDSELYSIGGSTFKKIIQHYNLKEHPECYSRPTQFRRQLLFQQQSAALNRSAQLPSRSCTPDLSRKDGLFNKYHKRMVHLDHRSQREEAKQDSRQVQRYFSINRCNMKDRHLFKMEGGDRTFIETARMDRQLKVDRLKNDPTLRDNFIVQNQQYHLSSYVMFTKFKDIFRDTSYQPS